MGDMADWIIENGLCDDEEPLFDYGGTKTCRHCGMNGLVWEKNHNGKWWLHEFNGAVVTPHKCKPKEDAR